MDFTPSLEDKRGIADFVIKHQGVIAAREQVMGTVAQWWQDNLPIVEALAPDAENQQARPRNVYVMRSSLLNSIEAVLAGQSLLNRFQVRGAFANFVNQLKADFKSIAASGWGPELIPEEEILQSQFPEVLESLEQAQNRLAELQALFAAADDEDFDDADDTGVLPGEDVKSKKEELKACTAEWKAQLALVKSLAGDLYTELKSTNAIPKGVKKGYYCTEGFTQKEPAFDNGHRILALAQEAGLASDYIDVLRQSMSEGQRALQRAASITASLERHKALEDEVKELRSTIKSIESRRDDLVESARAKITADEARVVILARLEKTLYRIYQGYLNAQQRACIKAIENLWSKYAVTARQIEAERDAASQQLQVVFGGVGV
jgi:hypothetical protein